MTQYIDKDALVAEIKSRISGIDVSQKAGMIKKRDADKKIFLLKSVLTLIDTLEVEEVDIDAEWKRYFEHRGEVATVNVKHLAKHFFELGMAVSNKAQKGK